MKWNKLGKQRSLKPAGTTIPTHLFFSSDAIACFIDNENRRSGMLSKSAERKNSASFEISKRLFRHVHC